MRGSLSLCALLALAACNDAPSSAYVQIVPIEPSDVEGTIRSQDTFTVDIVGPARDLQNDPLSYTYEWSVNGEVRSDLTSAEVPADVTTKGDVWEVRVTANDGKKDGDPGTASVTIANSPPDAEASTTAVEVVSTESLSMTGSGSDYDGDPVEVFYYWTRDGNGTPVDGPTVPASLTYPGETWIGHAVADDGEDRSIPATVSIRILNGLPVVDSLSLTPDSPFTDEDIVAVVEASDPDNQPVELTYTWTVDGATVLEGVDRHTLSADLFTKNKVIELSVTPNDGVDEGKAARATVTVNNTPPTTPSVIFAPEAPIPGVDDLKCSIDVASFDEDGDPIEYVIGWTLDGTPFTGAVADENPNDTIPTANLADGQVWVCSVTPFDGQENGVPATIEVIPETWAGARTFTNCGNTGNKGPTQTKCDAVTDGYAGTALEDEVTVDEGIQEWTVPVDGLYRITARGAEGGHAARSGASYRGGPGAIIRGDFSLKRGDILQVAVGQMGRDDGYSAGGGGGSWVMRSDDTPLLIAGGGGATNYYGKQNVRSHGCTSNTMLYGTYGNGTSTSSRPSSMCRIKTSDLRGGGRVPGTYCGNGGGGIDRDGANEPASWISGQGGKSWVNGVLGGSGGAAGGFGAGGAGTGSWGTGGGGGYSGGDAGRGISGAGGSYNSGSNPSNSSGQRGHGEVIIDWLGFE